LSTAASNSPADKVDIDGWSCTTATPARTLDLFEQVRGRCPVAYSNEHEGFHILVNYADVKNAMADYGTFSSQPQVLRPTVPRDPIPGLEMDPPQHTEWRTLLNKAIRPGTIAAVEPLVRRDINAHIDAIVGQGSCDLVPALTDPVPAEAVCRLVGLDDDLVPIVRDSALAPALGQPRELARRRAIFSRAIRSEVRKRREEPRDDYLTILATTEIEGQLLGDAELVSFIATFLGAGHHTTASAMTSLIYEIFSSPEVADALRDDPAKIPAAVEETLRLHPPFYGFFRRITKSMKLHDVPVAAGDDIFIGWAAANRDPAMFEEPERFRLDRARNKHMAFGFGVHRCLGARLAQMELRVVVEELFRRLPDLTLACDEPAYEFGMGNYAFIPSLPVTFTPAKPA
jgi:cytochrome P450